MTLVQVRVTYPYEEFDEGYTGVVLVIEPGKAFTKGGRNPICWFPYGSVYRVHLML